MASPRPQSRFVANGGVRLHSITAGKGSAVVLLHGIPDFCNGWRYQIGPLSERHCVAAMDLRGVNRSDQPNGVAAYRMVELVSDVVAIVNTLGGRAALVGHDWGAILAWWTATLRPQMVSSLAVLSAPHPLAYLAARSRGLLRYPRQYLDQIVETAPGAPFDPVSLSAWVPEQSARLELEQALARSDPEAIRNLYRANLANDALPRHQVPKLQVPTLIMYGADDDFIPPAYYDDSMKHVAGRARLVAIPNSGHFIHQQAAERVSAELCDSLADSE